MKPSDICKSYGIEGLNELSELTGMSVIELISAFNNDKQAFNSIINTHAKIKFCKSEYLSDTELKKQVDKMIENIFIHASNEYGITVGKLLNKYRTKKYIIDKAIDMLVNKNIIEIKEKSHAHNGLIVRTIFLTK
jgi:hypothetical protein